MGEPLGFSAFISHASGDEAHARAIGAVLEKRGFRCWIAHRDVAAGEEFGTEIIRGIEKSRCFVLVLSTRANASFYVRREVERAVTKGKPIHTIRIENVLPSPELELFVSSTNWINAWNGPLVSHAEKLADSIERTRIPYIQAEDRKAYLAHSRKPLEGTLPQNPFFVLCAVAVCLLILLDPRHRTEAICVGTFFGIYAASIFPRRWFGRLGNWLVGITSGILGATLSLLLALGNQFNHVINLTEIVIAGFGTVLILLLLRFVIR